MTEKLSGQILANSPGTPFPQPVASSVAVPDSLRDAAAKLRAEGRMPPLCIQPAVIPLPLTADKATAYKDLLPLLPRLLPNVPIVPSACMIVGFVLKTKELYEIVKTNPHFTKKLTLDVFKWFVHLPEPIALLIPELEPVAAAVKPVALFIETGEAVHRIAIEPIGSPGTMRYELIPDWDAFIAKFTHPGSA